MGEIEDDIFELSDDLEGGNMNVIEVENINKFYGKAQAVKSMNFSINKNEIFGIVGANGAGKTTLIEMIIGLKRPSSGNIKVLGYDLKTNKEDIKERIGVLLQEGAIYSKLKIKEALILYRSYYSQGLDLNEIIEKLGLESVLNKYYKNLSGGWKQRVLLALALVNNPEILILDEPTTGLDPKAREILWRTILYYKSENKTIILTTHYLEEITRYCDRVMIIKDGEIVGMDNPKVLIANMDKEDATLDDVYNKLAFND